MVLHGLAGTRGSVEPISSQLRGRGLRRAGLRRARPRRLGRRGHARRAARGGGPARCSGTRSRARPDVSDTRIGAWGISYGGGQIWNALAAGVPFAAAEVVETWTSLYDALWPQDLARSGIVAGFAASVAARSPLIAGLRDAAVQSTNPAAIRAARRRALGAPKARLDPTPVYLFQGRTDFAFDISQATRAYARLAGPKRSTSATFGHTPSTFPGAGHRLRALGGPQPGSTAT